MQIMAYLMREPGSHLLLLQIEHAVTYSMCFNIL